MKKAKWALMNLIGTGAIFGFSAVFANEAPAIIYLIDPDDPEAKQLAMPETLSENSEAQALAPRNLDELIQRLADGGPELTTRQKRIVKRIEADQKEFLKVLNQFVTAKFNREDDGAELEFVRIRDRVTKLTFDAPNEKYYYERLYLINELWLANPEQIARFDSLDRAMRDKWAAIAERRRRIQQYTTIGLTVVGAAAGGYLTYKKVWPVVADGKSTLTVMQGIGRSGAILIGAGVGAVVGGYVGYLGSDLVMRQLRDYIDPIDGSEDLRDVLDVIEQMP